MTARIPSILILLCVLALTLAPVGLALAQTPAPAPAAPPRRPARPRLPQPRRLRRSTAATPPGSWCRRALVLLMTAPGLALFYGGMVRQKNALGTLMQSFIILALISVQWVLWGYSLAFGPDKGGIIGGLEWVGLRGVGPEPNADYAATIPHTAFMLFQMMFAVITPALITGAFAERKKFSTFLVFILLWATFVYDPLAHWVWGIGGWLKNLGALDFAGGTVVHISSGISALAAAIVIGKRRGYGHQPMPPHNLPFTVMGASLAVVRLVRVQRGQRAGRQRPRRARVHDHQHRGRGGRARVDVHGVGVARQADRARRGVGGGGRPRRHHPGGRIRDPDGLDRHRRGGRASSATPPAT